MHTTSVRSDIVTSVCPGQGNVSKHLFSLSHHEIDKLNNRKYIELLKYAQSLVPEVPIATYFSNQTYPANKALMEHQLSQTSFVQPLILLATYFNYSIFQDMYDWNVKNSDYILGHSLGELSALVVQDVVSLEDGLKAAYQRGRLMEQALVKNENKTKSEWGMVALLFRERDFESILKVCTVDIGFNVANINGYDQIVVSGKVKELNEKLKKLDQIQKELIALKQWRSRIKKIWLQTKVPAHHPVFDDMKSELKDIIHIQSEKLNVPVVCNLNGLIVSKNSQRVVDNFVDVTSKPVQFVKCLETISTSQNLKDNEKYKFLNVSDVTTGLIKRFFANNKDCEVFDLISEAEKEF